MRSYPTTSGRHPTWCAPWTGGHLCSLAGDLAATRTSARLSTATGSRSGLFPRDPDPPAGPIVIDTVESLMDLEASRPHCARRDEWIAAGVFAELEAGTRVGYDCIVELDLEFVAIDGSIRKDPVAVREPARALLIGPNSAKVERGRCHWSPGQ